MHNSQGQMKNLELSVSLKATEVMAHGSQRSDHPVFYLYGITLPPIMEALTFIDTNGH